MKKFLLLASCLLLAACAGPPHQFTAQELTQVDTATGIVWAKNANLAGKPLPWKGDGSVSAFLQKLNRQMYGGYADWRVPTKEEMADLLAFAKAQGYLPDKMETWPFQQLRKLGFQEVKDYGYWTATRRGKDQHWVADLASGELHPRPDSKAYNLWPVRGGRGR
jgi:hypothetical protein